MTPIPSSAAPVIPTYWDATFWKRGLDLLVTDVGLPGGMNCRQVADAARAFRPELKVLFVTGYAENASVGNGHLDAGMQVIAKPFAMTDFGNKVREIIER
jgi:CheY-like chemotaxis protein